MDRSLDEKYMSLAIDLAKEALAAGEIPVGAVIVKDGQVISQGKNQKEHKFDPTSHAEIEAIRQACKTINNWRLTGCTIYVTLEPCVMCAGALINSRISRCVVGALDSKSGALDSLYAICDDPRLNHAFPVTYGVLEDECSEILESFFKSCRDDE